MRIINWWMEMLPHLISKEFLWYKSDEDRHYLVSMLLWASTAALLCFAIIHYLHHSPMLAAFQLLLAIIYMIILLTLEQKLSLQSQENILLSGTIAMFLTLLASGGLAKTGIYWVSLLPFLVFSIAGLRKGWGWLGIFVAGLMGVKTLDYYHIFQTAYSLEEIQYFLSSFFFYSIIAMILEATRLRQQIDLEHNNEVLMHMREELNTTLENLEKQVEDRTNDLKTSNKRLL
ncbi:MAG: hypothetical protein R8M45_09815, partial [Ghiorsea sp.]